MDWTKVTCECCKEEMRIPLYFSNARIISTEMSALNNEVYYEAVVEGKAICPNCGCMINKSFKKHISPGHIIELAVGDF
jgi:hypothetical protein